MGRKRGGEEKEIERGGKEREGERGRHLDDDCVAIAFCNILIT